MYAERQALFDLANSASLAERSALAPRYFGFCAYMHRCPRGILDEGELLLPCQSGHSKELVVLDLFSMARSVTTSLRGAVIIRAACV